MLLDKLEFGLVVFKTDDAVFCVRPSGWQRVYLLWTFRHFHKLQVKLLNGRQRQLVESLYRSGSPRLSGRQERTHIIGTIEDADLQLPLPVRVSTTRPANQELPKPFLIPVSQKNVTRKSNETDDRTVAEPLLRRSQSPHDSLGWSRVGQSFAVGALCILVATAAWHRLEASANHHVANAQKSAQADPSTPVNAVAQNEAAPAPIEQLTTAPVLQSVNAPNDPTVSTASQPIPVAEPVMPTAHTALPAKPPGQESAGPTARIAHASQPALILPLPAAHYNSVSDDAAHVNTPSNFPVAEADGEASLPNVSRPPLKLVYPVSPENGLRGSVALQAVLGADGAVERIKVVSGNPALANAAIRAVRQWHYAPYYKDGHALETETNIRISFIASDAISVSFPASAIPPR